TLQELGYKDFDITGWFGFLFPASTPKEHIDRIYRESKTALGTPEVARVIGAAGMYVVGSSPAEFAAFLQRDYDYQDKLMTELGPRPKYFGTAYSLLGRSAVQARPFAGRTPLLETLHHDEERGHEQHGKTCRGGHAGEHRNADRLAGAGARAACQ